MSDYDDKKEPSTRFNAGVAYGGDPEAPLDSFETSIKRDKDLGTFLENTEYSLETTCKWIDLLNDSRDKLAESFRSRALILNTLAEELEEKANIFESFYDDALNEQSKGIRDMASAVVSLAENTKNGELQGLALLRKAYGRLERSYELHNQLNALLEEYKSRQHL